MVPPTSPSWTVQVTVPSRVPVTVAVNARFPHASTAPLAGLMATTTAGGDGTAGCVTVAVASALAVGSATLVAIGWQSAGVEGAMYTPEGPMLPQPDGSRSDQLTEPFFVPLTVAVKATDPPAETVAALGDTATATWPTFTLPLAPELGLAT